MESTSLKLLLLLSLITLNKAIEDNDAFPGWKGGTYRNKWRHRKLVSKGIKGPDPLIFDPARVIQIGWKPRAFLYKGFLSDEECEYLKEKATPQLERSYVADSVTGDGVLSEVRTSSGMFFSKGENEVISRIEKRISTWTHLPIENGEAIQVLRYELGQKYEPHYDYFFDPVNIQQGGHRYATVLMYLADVLEGGETVFPNAPARPHQADWSECGKSGLGVKPEKGDALLFFSLSVDAKPDESSLHSSCPVIRGEKWSATKWIHVASFDGPGQDPDKCENNDPSCEAWAAAGECTKNPGFMVGTANSLGSCRLACGVCKA